MGVPDVYKSLNPESGLQVQYRYIQKIKKGVEGVHGSFVAKKQQCCRDATLTSITLHSLCVLSVLKMPHFRGIVGH